MEPRGIRTEPSDPFRNRSFAHSPPGSRYVRGDGHRNRGDGGPHNVFGPRTGHEYHQSKRGSDRAFLNTAWVTQICRGILLYFFALSVGLLIFLADRAGIVPKNSAYADPRLPYVIAVLSFSALIGGFQSTKLFEARRNLLLGMSQRLKSRAKLWGCCLCSDGHRSTGRSGPWSRVTSVRF